MPTRPGWAVLIGSLAALAAGRLFGIFELYLVATCGIALLLAALVIVRRTRARLDVDRRLQPPRVHAGSPSRVVLEVTNRGNRRSPLLTLRDPVGQGRSASVIVAPLPTGTSVTATYRLPTDRRGILQVGPLGVEVSDPFGLAAARTEAAPVVELTIWPAVDDVPSLPHTMGDDPHGGADHPNTLSAGGEDFYGLRPYVVGDDLRRVHWKATARHDELMVRQDELPWQGRATVLLDTRASAYDEASFERAVSAAASIATACARRRFLLRLLTASGDDTGYGAGAAHVEHILERLATIELDTAAGLDGPVSALRRGAGSGAFAALVGAAAPGDLDALARLRRSFPASAVVAFRAATGPQSRGPSPPGVAVVDEHHPFPTVWASAITGRRRIPA